MKMTPAAAVAVIAFSIFTSSSLICAQDTSTRAESPADELQALQGIWEGVEVGRKDQGKCKIAVEKNTLRFEGPTKEEWYAATITLPAGKTPKQLHGTITKCSHPDFVGKVAIAIYKIEGGTLTLAGREPGVLEAPQGFKGDPNTRTFVLKKTEPEKGKSARGGKAEPKLKGQAGENATVEQRFHDADIALAIAQYEKLQSAAFEMRLQLELEPPDSERQANELAKKAEMLRHRAAELREETRCRWCSSWE